MKEKNRIYFFSTGFTFFCMKYIWRYKIIHPERLENLHNCIIASNHISWFDPPFLGAIMPIQINILAKSEIFKYKLFSKYLKAVNAIPIRRGTIDRNAFKIVKEKLSSGQSILLFPEGTRNSGKSRPGIGKIAIQTGRDILPIFVKNTDKLWECFLRKKKLIFVIGERIPQESYSDLDDKKDNYRSLANTIFSKICELENECPVG